MKYYKINYDKLQNLKQIAFYKLVIILFLLIIFLTVLSCKTMVSKKITLFGFIDNGILKINVESELSDIIKNAHELEFNGQKKSYQILEFGDFEIDEKGIYQEISLVIDDVGVQNKEVGKVTICYDEQKIINYILELFK